MKVGRFDIEVGSPYPVWITIGDDQGCIKLRHSELRDLEYAIDWAIRHAQVELAGPGKDRSDEV